MASSEASPLLAIATGNTITTWKCLVEDSEDTVNLYPHGNFPVGDLSWNHNGQVVATCSAVSTEEQAHANIVLTAAMSGNVLDSFQHNHGWQPPQSSGTATSLAFGGKSRYLCIGDTSGALCLWDLKKKLRVRQFFPQNQIPSLQVALDPSDTFVESLSEVSLDLYNLRQGSLVATFSPVGNYSFTSFANSTLEPHLAAVGTDDGSLLLYDIQNHHKTVPFFGLSRRQPNITSLAFSPTNRQLLASTSSDGSLKFFDKASGNTIQKLASLNSPITSLSLHSDGISCAVGCESGEARVYDLRQNEPVASLYVQGPVTSLQFAPPPKSKSGTATPGSVIKRENPNRINTLDPQIDQLRRDLDQVTGFTPTPGRQQLPQQSEVSVSVAADYAGPTGSTASVQPQNLAEQQPPISMSAATATQQASPRKSLYTNPATAQMSTESFYLEEIRESIKEEVENLRDDMEESIRNLHMDMISQFHQQSQELQNALTSQLATVDRVMEENRKLREENERLRGRR